MFFIQLHFFFFFLDNTGQQGCTYVVCMYILSPNCKPTHHIKLSTFLDFQKKQKQKKTYGNI